MQRSLILAAAMAAACGGSASSSATVSGSAHGHALQTPYAVSGSGTITTANGNTNVAAILLSNDSAACADIGASKQPKNAQFMILALADVNSSTGTFTVPTAAGDYQVYSGSGQPTAKLALVQFSSTDATCKDQPGQDAQGVSGVVHLTGVSNGVFSGTFDVTVAETDSSGNRTATTDHWTGSFNPSACAAVATALNGNGNNTTCY